jgi:hypothetical protein
MPVSPVFTQDVGKDEKTVVTIYAQG